MRIFSIVAVASLGLTGPAFAQSIDFGDDSSQWSNDGECDDPRFEGPGMTTTPLLDSDIRADATDCRTAYEAGRLALRGEAPLDIERDPVFGDDTNEWANDGECDDRRFYGAGMASDLAISGIGTDAADCRSALESGLVAFWDMTAAVQATQCDAINFGDDSNEYAYDGECDDPRFEGLGSASVVSTSGFGTDATDCSRLCGYGAIALRDY
jgi:hypothetical protein